MEKELAIRTIGFGKQLFFVGWKNIAHSQTKHAEDYHIKHSYEVKVMIGFRWLLRLLMAKSEFNRQFWLLNNVF